MVYYKERRWGRRVMITKFRHPALEPSAEAHYYSSRRQ